jgi:hypothetical protein
MKKLDEQVKKEQQAGGEKDPNASAGASITRFAVDVESRGRDLTKVLNDQVIQPLAKDVAPRIKDFSKAFELGSSTVVRDKFQAPIAAGYDKARLSRIAVEEAGDKSGPTTGVGKSDAAAKDVKEFNALINGSQKQSEAALKVIEKIANEKSISKEDVIKGAMANKGAGMADIVSQIKKELPATEQLGYKDAKKTELEKQTGKLVSPANEKPVLESVGKGVEAFGGLFRETPGKVEIVKGSATSSEAMPAPKRSSGSLEMAGKMFEDWGKGTMVELHGLESVMRPEDMSKVIESAMGGVRKTMPKFEMPKLDLSSMSKTVNTSISSVTGGKEMSTKLSVEDMADLQKPFKKSFAELSSGFDELMTESSSIVKENSDQIKADISDALPIKEVAAKQQEFQSQFTESQQKIIDDYKGYSEENRSFHAQALEAGVKEDTETAKIIGDRISKMKAAIGDRQATEEEQKALDNEAANKAMFEQQVEKKKEMLDVMHNLGEYSAKRELELKQKSINDALAIDDKKAEAIKANISAELPVDTNFGDLDGAMARNTANDERLQAQAAWDSAVPDKINDPSADKASKKSIADMMGGLSIGPNGMPIVRSIDSAKQTLNQKTPSPGKKINPETGEEYTPVEELEKQQRKKAATEKTPESKGAGTKEATLDDLLKSMNALNTKVAQLIAVNEDGHKSTAKAAKSNNANLYTR